MQRRRLFLAYFLASPNHSALEFASAPSPPSEVTGAAAKDTRLVLIIMQSRMAVIIKRKTAVQILISPFQVLQY